MATTDRAIDRLLNNLQRSAGLTEDGRNWMIQACDPFHDVDLKCSGYPDLRTGSSVVQLVKKQLQLVRPTTVADPNNWDASIVLASNCKPTDYTEQFNVTNGYVTASVGEGFENAAVPVNTVTVGGLTVMSGPQGALTSQSGTVPASNQLNFASLDCTEYLKGNCRIIAMGFEVVNTTAELYKQGQVSVWRLPNNATLDEFAGQCITYNTDDFFEYNTTLRTMRAPPASIAEVNNLFGTRTWDAKEGAYVVARQNSSDNPAIQPSFQPTALCTNDVSLNGTNNYLVQARAPPFAGVGDLCVPFDMSGAYFTGLSSSTSLTVTVRWYIERFPGPQETDLVVLATPSAAYDPLALELYIHAMHGAPPGVMVRENPLGEWFKNVLTAAAKWVPKITGALDTVIPGAEAIGKVIAKGAALGAQKIQNNLDKKQQKKALAESRSNLAKTN